MPTSRPPLAASLTNDIHPLLAREKFPEYIKYDEVFSQPARLATRMLSHENAQHYFFTLITQSKHVSTLPLMAKFERHRIYPPKGVKELTDDDRKLVEDWMLRLADHVSFAVRECTGGKEMAEVFPKNMEKHENSTNADLLVKSVISLSRSQLYDTLLQENASPEERLVRQFDLAETLVHEIAHSASLAITGRRRDDFFGFDIAAEAGYALESCLWGGSVPSCTLSEPFRAEYWPWPCRALLQSYEEADVCSDSEKLEDGHREGDFGADGIRNLFSDEFWESISVKEDKEEKAQHDA